MQNNPDSTEADDVLRAEQRVLEQKARLSRSLRQVTASGEAMARQLSRELKPAAIAAVAVAGAAGATVLTVALVRRARRRSHWFAPQEPSRLAVVAKTAGLWALRLLARRVAQEVVARLNEPQTTTPDAARRPAATSTALG